MSTRDYDRIPSKGAAWALLIFASIIAIPISTFTSISVTFKVLELIIGLGCLLVGTVIAYKLGEK